MGKNTKYAIGIFVEGTHLHGVCLMEKDGVVRLVDAEIIQMVEQAEPVGINSDLVPEFTDDLADGAEGLEFSEDFSNSDVLLSEFENEAYTSNSTELNNLLAKYAGKNYSIALSLPEPQIYYAFFNSDWGLKKDKLKKRVIEELAKLRPDAELLQPSDIALTTLQDGRLVATVRDGEINLISDLESAYNRSSERIAFIETAEFSLINLIRTNYDFGADEVNLVIYIGYEFSRLIFMQGNEILNISYLIGVGLDSENIVNTIYSRILLEQDNLNLAGLNSIIIAGQGFETGINGVLQEKFSEETRIENLNLQQLGIPGSDSMSSRFAVPIGAALRGLDPAEKSFYKIDLTPPAVKESRKKFKLGLLGWLLLLLVPFAAHYFTVKIFEQHNQLKVVETQIRSRKVELSQLEETEMRLNVQRQKLKQFDRTLGVLDSIPLNISTWSDFLGQIASVAQKTKHIWITEASRENTEKVTLKGYSVYRNKIPLFVNSLENAQLKKVEVQEIREKTVYNFELEIAMKGAATETEKKKKKKK